MSTKSNTTTDTKSTKKVTVTWRETAEYSFDVTIPADITTPDAVEEWIDAHCDEWVGQVPKKVWLAPMAVYDRDIIDVAHPPVASILFG